MERAAAEYDFLRFAGRGIGPRGATAAAGKKDLAPPGGASFTPCELEFPLHEHDIPPAFELQADVLEDADMLKAERGMQSY